jgi:hypothetical protein
MYYTKDDIQRQINFLKLVHPFLMDDEYHKECIQILTVFRNGKGERKSDKSLNIWRFDEKGQNYYNKYMDYLNSKDYVTCLYYSCFAKMEKNNINKSNTAYTQILPIDFDKQSYQEVMDQLKIFDKVNIEYNLIFTGGGYQVVILLDKPCYDKQIFSKFTSILLNLNLKVDDSIRDCARVFRLPNTYNSKYLTPKKTKLIKFTYERYSIEDVFSKLNSYMTQINLFDINNDIIVEPSPKKPLNDSNINSYMLIEDEYNKFIDFDSLPSPIQTMLKGTRLGLRNKVILFLIPFFRNLIGISKDKVINVLSVWGRYCNPVLEKEFIVKEVNRIWNYNYKSFGAYSKELAQEYGFIEFNEYHLSDKVKIPNILFKKYYEIHETAVRIILLMIAYERRFDIQIWDKKLICKYAGISPRTFDRYIGKVIDTKNIYIKTKHKNKNNYKYAINHSFYTDGYTAIDPNRIINLYFERFKSLNNSEAKLYMFLYQMIVNNANTTCYAKQEYIGQCIGKSQNRVSELTDNITEKKYIKKDAYKDNYYEHCIYTLL